MSGRIEALWIKRAHEGPMDPVTAARLHAGQGIADNADQGGRRQVTILSREVWDAVRTELGAEVPYSARRANVLVSGVPLADTAGRVLQLGACRVRILGETRPCGLMDAMQPGLREALRADWRGGAYGEVLDDGEIRVGDGVAWTDATE